MSKVGEADRTRTDSEPKVGSEKNSKSPDDANDSASTGSSSSEKGRCAKIRDHQYARACWNFVTWTPKRCRWDPQSPSQFSMGLNLLFGFVSTFVYRIVYCEVFENGYVRFIIKASQEITLPLVL
jgi:hypothetical protein